MEIKLATVCEYVIIDNTGKLSIMGIFDAINASSFPVVINKMYLVLALKGDASEVGDHDMGLRFTGEDDDDIIAPGKFKFTLNDGVTPSSNVIIDFNNMQIQQAGDYYFKVNINEDLSVTIPLKVTSALN